MEILIVVLGFSCCLLLVRSWAVDSMLKEIIIKQDEISEALYLNACALRTIAESKGVYTEVKILDNLKIN